VNHASEALIKARTLITDFDVPLANLKSILEVCIGNAFAAPDLTTRLGLLCRELELAISRGRISLPDRFRTARSDRYARRLVCEDPATGVSVLAMVWGPGQSTPLHDHSGLWGVEAVLAGEIESLPFELIGQQLGQQRGEYYFHPRPAERLPAGSTTYLMPPFEHHITRNVSQRPAVTLNIYGGEMAACNVFLPTGSGTYTRQSRVLSYTD
jgi:predicted metal-dependent enzyme (double-stranded beta helix superfamily)